MKTETLKQLEYKLVDNMHTDDDEWRFNRMAEKYANMFEEIIKFYHLEDMPAVFEAVKEVLRKAQIKEYFLEKEVISSVDKILNRAKN